MSKSKEEEVRSGQNAERILNDELFKDSFAYLRDLYLTEWENSPVRDPEGRERLWLAIKILATVENHITTIMQTGKLADRQLEELTKEVSVGRGVAN